VGIVPDSMEARLLLGEILIARQDWEAAVQVFEALLGDAPDDPVVLRQIGIVAAAMGDHPRAEEVLRHALELDPDLVATHLALGRLYVRQQLWVDAGEAARSALNVLPGYAESLLLLATAEQGRGSTEGATNALVELLTADSYHLEALLKLGEILAAAGQFADARRALQRLVRLDPMSLEARYHLGLVLVEEGRMSAALALLRSVAEGGGDSILAARATAAIQRVHASRTAL
jgi:protein O-GlcNAc transferase